MSSKRPEGYVVGQWLAQRQTSISSLLQLAAQYAEATRMIHAQFSSAWALQLRVVRLRGDTLVIYSDTAAATVMARAHQQQMINLVSPLLSHPPQRIALRVVPRVSNR